jgi:hypothetical protein
MAAALERAGFGLRHQPASDPLPAQALRHPEIADKKPSSVCLAREARDDCLAVAREDGERFPGLTGGLLPDGKGKAPDITAHGLRNWSESDISEALSTGFTPSGDALGSAMAAVVRSLSHAPDADLAAIAHYLKSYHASAAE